MRMIAFPEAILGGLKEYKVSQNLPKLVCNQRWRYNETIVVYHTSKKLTNITE